MNLRVGWPSVSCRAALVGAVMLATQAGGCSSGSGRSPYTIRDEVLREPQRARDLHAQATEAMHKGDAAAERLLREALAADLYHGPAHNNLGALLLRRGRLYEAAGEFEWARKLMPGHPDPRVNLAMTLERAGKVDDALQAYDSALAVHDNYLPAMQGKARLQIAAGRTDRATPFVLDQIALRGEAPWRDWALLWKAKLGVGAQ